MGGKRTANARRGKCVRIKTIIGLTEVIVYICWKGNKKLHHSCACALQIENVTILHHIDRTLHLFIELSVSARARLIHSCQINWLQSKHIEMVVVAVRNLSICSVVLLAIVISSPQFYVCLCVCRQHNNQINFADAETDAECELSQCKFSMPRMFGS